MSSATFKNVTQNLFACKSYIYTYILDMFGKNPTDHHFTIIHLFQLTTTRQPASLDSIPKWIGKYTQTILVSKNKKKNL